MSYVHGYILTINPRKFYNLLISSNLQNHAAKEFFNYDGFQNILFWLM